MSLTRARASDVLASLFVFAAMLAAFLAFGPTLSYGTDNSLSNTVGVLNVISACFIALSPNTINFGAIEPTANVPTNQLVQDTDLGGNVNANMLVGGTNWIFGTNSFFASNTLWDGTSDATYLGNPLVLYPGLSDTGITVRYGPTPANVYFGLAVPLGTQVGTYTQNIVIENSC